MSAKARSSCTCPSWTASRPGTARRSSTRCAATATGPPGCSTRCRSRTPSRSSTRTGSGTWPTSTAWTSSWPRRQRRPAGSTRCSSPPGRCGRRSSSRPDVRLAAYVLRHQRHLDREQDRRAGRGATRRHRPGRPELPPVASLRADAGRRHGHLPRRLPAEQVFDVRRGAAAGDQAPAAGAAAGGQAGPGQDAAADQLHLRRDHL